jgi:hypothetical protein
VRGQARRHIEGRYRSVVAGDAVTLPRAVVLRRDDAHGELERRGVRGDGQQHLVDAADDRDGQAAVGAAVERAATADWALRTIVLEIAARADEVRRRGDRVGVADGHLCAALRISASVPPLPALGSGRRPTPGSEALERAQRVAVSGGARARRRGGPGRRDARAGLLASLSHALTP